MWVHYLHLFLHDGLRLLNGLALHLLLGLLLRLALDGFGDGFGLGLPVVEGNFLIRHRFVDLLIKDLTFF